MCTNAKVVPYVLFIAIRKRYAQRKSLPCIHQALDITSFWASISLSTDLITNMDGFADHASSSSVVVIGDRTTLTC